jgi:hypothetical protein
MGLGLSKLPETSAGTNHREADDLRPVANVILSGFALYFARLTASAAGRNIHARFRGIGGSSNNKLREGCIMYSISLSAASAALTP